MIDLFVNFIVFFNVIMREILIYYEEEFNYNWLIGVGIFLFILFMCFSRGNRRIVLNWS